MSTVRPRTVSGMRPTGPLHLGHYFGVLKNWVELQHTEEAYFFVADWHALTSDYADPSNIATNVEEMVKDWVAAGLDPEKCVIFRQSAVKEHAELSLLLSMITPVSWLERNPTYKEQQQQITNKDLGNAGFLCYPVLMAADILMYRPHGVPVGEDQLPHMELTREIARRFNYLYGGNFFPEPQAMLTPAAKCPGLDGRKMSKSYNNGIFLRDTMADIEPKVRGMFTDPARLRKSDPGNPDVCNLFPYHVLLASPEEQAEIRTGCTGASFGCVECKKRFLKNLEAFLAPPLLEQPRIVRNAKNEVHIDVESEGTDIYYTTDGTEPTAQSAKYEVPFILDKKGTVKAITYDVQSGKSGPVASRRFDLPAVDYKVTSPADERTNLMFDGNGYSTYYLPEGKNEIVVELAAPHTISGFVYTPNQGRDSQGHISNYQLSVDGKVVASGEFSNIKHNPIEQEIHFAPVKGKKLVFKATRIVDNVKRVGIAEFSVITED